MFRHMDKEGMIGVDIGGSHVSAAWIEGKTGSVIEETLCHCHVDGQASAANVIRDWVATIRATMKKLPGTKPAGVGIAMPGPFDYPKGVSLIAGLHKYERLLGLNVAAALRQELDLGADIPIVFENDASCFGLGESLTGKASGYRKVITLTLGTGLGSTFVSDGRICGEGVGVPPGGFLYNYPFKDKTAEDYISARWLLGTYAARTGTVLANVRELACRAEASDRDARFIFAGLGHHLGVLLGEWIPQFGAECLVIGGNIARAADWFLPELRNVFTDLHIDLPIYFSDRTELSAMEGAAGLLRSKETSISNKPASWRKSSQPLMPQVISEHPTNAYDRFPFQDLGKGRINTGYDSLAEWMMTQKSVRIDGYVGNDWEAIREHLGASFRQKGIHVAWYEAGSFLKPEPEIVELTKPFVGEPGSVWGRLAGLELEDFFQPGLKNIRQDGEGFDLLVVIGIGAALVPWTSPVVYVDLPKNEIQYRMRAGSALNLGISSQAAHAEMYKRYYFVDWVVLNRHRVSIKDSISVIADGQWKDDISWAKKESVAAGLQQLAGSVLRVRPWFEAGAWGGQWMKEHIPGLPQDEVNYAWSFELIVPENGLVFGSGGKLLEVSFDWLMEQENESVLGRDAARFGTEFPIRFDFLDTFDGGNLSIQVHPSLKYIREQFGERITQDETYYILDCTEDAGVYLGFQDDIEPVHFRETLESSVRSGKAIDIEQFVQRHPAHRHDLFLIPNGTIHSSGKNNLVLEISATPYIYTFKMYDWVRLDLNGQPRPINIEHAFQNLRFERKGEKAREELLSRPRILEEKDGYKLVHVPTHAEHFYDVHRIEFTGSVTVATDNQCHVLMVVEGPGVVVEAGGQRQHFHYAETFVIPAAAKSYKLHTAAGQAVKVVKAFVK